MYWCTCYYVSSKPMSICLFFIEMQSRCCKVRNSLNLITNNHIRRLSSWEICLVCGIGIYTYNFFLKKIPAQVALYSLLDTFASGARSWHLSALIITRRNQAPAKQWQWLFYSSSTPARWMRLLRFRDAKELEKFKIPQIKTDNLNPTALRRNSWQNKEIKEDFPR